MKLQQQTVQSPKLRRHYRIVHIYIFAAVILYILGSFWNYYLFGLGGFYDDWLLIGRWRFCIGDLLYLCSFSLALSIPLRYKDMT